MKNLLARIRSRRLISKESMAYKLAVEESVIDDWASGTSFPNENTAKRFRKEFGLDPFDERARMPLSTREKVANRLIVISSIVLMAIYSLCVFCNFWPVSGPLWLLAYVGFISVFAYSLAVALLNRKHILSMLCFAIALISLPYVIIDGVYIAGFLNHFVF